MKTTLQKIEEKATMMAKLSELADRSTGDTKELLIGDIILLGEQLEELITTNL